MVKFYWNKKLIIRSSKFFHLISFHTLHSYHLIAYWYKILFNIFCMKLNSMGKYLIDIWWCWFTVFTLIALFLTYITSSLHRIPCPFLMQHVRPHHWQKQTDQMFNVHKSPQIWYSLNRNSQLSITMKFKLSNYEIPINNILLKMIANWIL